MLRKRRRLAASNVTTPLGPLVQVDPTQEILEACPQLPAVLCNLVVAYLEPVWMFPGSSSRSQWRACLKEFLAWSVLEQWTASKDRDQGCEASHESGYIELRVHLDVEVGRLTGKLRPCQPLTKIPPLWAVSTVWRCACSEPFPSVVVLFSDVPSPGWGPFRVDILWEGWIQPLQVAPWCACDIRCTKATDLIHVTVTRVDWAT
jgi:hypothetical protein